MKALYNDRWLSTIPHYLLGCLVLFFVSNVWSQNIQQLEYYYGTDPGFGNATSVTPTANTGEFTQTLTLPLTGLQEGFHRLSLRSKDDTGTWGLYEAVTFYISNEISGGGPISNIAAAEYWFDSDPGLGNGVPLTISGSPSDTTLSFVIPLGTLEVGFHNLGIRSKNLAGTWSLYEKKIFYIFKAEENLNPAALSGVEFLYDAELGFGTGTLANLTATGNPDEYLVEIPTNLVSCDIHDVWLSVKNADGKYSLYQIALDVDVFDNLPPTIVVFPNITAVLNASGQASITINDVNNGTFDDCELVSVVLNQAQFNYTCANLGSNTVTVTATDAEGKVSTQNVTVTVVDNINPVAVAQNISVSLNATGSVTVSPNQVENGSTDNCSIANSSLSITQFSCDNLGINSLTYTVMDASGNTNSTPVTVTVIDNTNPNAMAQNITLQLDANGMATLTAASINQSTDNCSIASATINTTSFNCTNLGPNTVMLTVTDPSGNTASTNATITVVDAIVPTVITQNLTVQLNASGMATILASQIENGSTDNCTIASSSLNVTTFDCDELGINTITLSVTDQSGNVGSATATVTVEDNINPVAIGQDIVIDLGGQSSISITPNDVDNGSSDNCAGFSLSIDFDTFTTPGMYPVILTVTDGSGNSSTYNVTVTVTDTTLTITETTALENQIVMYPVPTKQMLNIATELQIDTVQLYDVTGRIIVTIKEPGTSIDVSQLSSGTYFIKFFVNNSTLTKQFIKQ